MNVFLKFLVVTGLIVVSVFPSFAQTVVAAHTIRSKSLIRSSDITLLEDTVSGTFQRPNQIIGQEARRILYPGRPIRISDVGPPAIISRNQIVTIFFENGSLLISVEGRALSRGGLGDKIRVMNLTSRTTITGVVSGPALIKVMR